MIRFKLFSSIPVRISPFFWLLAAAIGWLNSGSLLGAFLWICIIALSVLIHELGHALTALAFGQKVRIELMGMGGETHRSGKSLKLWQDFFITFNGPLAGFFLFGLAYSLLSLTQGHPIFEYLTTITLYINLFWTVVNLLPIFPLDGGQLLRIVLEGIFGLPGLKSAFFFSLIIAIFCGLISFIYQELFLGALFCFLAFESYQAWQESKALSTADRSQDLQQKMHHALEHQKRGHQQQAWDLLSEVREEAQKGILFLQATTIMAKILVDQSKLPEAYELLKPVKMQLDLIGLKLFLMVSFRLEKWEETLALGSQLYREMPDIETACVNAMCCGHLGQVRPALGWLDCAKQKGAGNLSQIVNSIAFSKMHSDPLFQSHIIRLMN